MYKVSVFGTYIYIENKQSLHSAVVESPFSAHAPLVVRPHIIFYPSTTRTSLLFDRFISHFILPPLALTVTVVGYFLGRACRRWCDAFGPLVAAYVGIGRTESTLYSLPFPPPESAYTSILQRKKKAIGVP